MTTYNLKSISHRGELREQLPNIEVSLNSMELSVHCFCIWLSFVFFSSPLSCSHKNKNNFNYLLTVQH